ncbi:MAG TPA: flagellar basal body P-ring formation chaperone FlgA [Terriglobia bacterium]|nr:flagellar basal body P-ring formation chaperone FlgA [Terriglobia bacterium]
MRFRITTIVLPFLLAVAGCANAGPSVRTRLLSRVTLHSESFTLADLLPPSAPSGLRAEAAKIPLGEAPQPSATRILYRQQLEYLLRGHKALLAALSLPSQIDIQRTHRALTRGEILSAINHALGGQALTGSDPLNLKGLELNAPVYVTDKDPGLRVLRIESDPLRNETRFRLWTSKEPGNLPFSVTVPGAVKLPTLVARHMLTPGEIVSATDFAVEMRPQGRNAGDPPAAAAELDGLTARAPVREGQPVSRNQFHQPVLVEPGTLATLILQGAGFSIKTIVTPLEQGVLGQEIRVRNKETRQVVEAKVTGRDRLLKTR